MSSNIRVERICKHCGGLFVAKTTVTKYCGDICAKRAYKQRKKQEKIEASNQETSRLQLQPIEELNSKVYLSITETMQLLGISKSTIYRMMKKGAINFAKFRNRTLIRRIDLDLLFEVPKPVEPSVIRHDIEDCYNMKEIQSLFGISEKALYELVNRNSLPKIKSGKFVYVPKAAIDSLLNQPTSIKDNDQSKVENKTDFRQSA